MRCLLDTHVVLWWLADDPALTPGVNTFFENPANELFVSAISIWEIAIKSQLGKLSTDIDDVRAALAPAGLQPLSFGMADAAEVATLPLHHRDPFDRALIAQAQSQGLRLITTDATLAQYGASILLVADIR